MKRIVATMTCLSVAPLALAQQAVSVNLTHDDADGVIEVGDSVTWSLTISFSDFDPGWVVGLADISILGDDLLGVASDMSYEFFNAGSFFGESNGSGVSEIRFGNAPFCVDPPFCTPARDDNPLLVGTFVFTASGAGSLDYQVTEGSATWGFVEMQLDQPTRIVFDENTASIQVDQLLITPAPSTATLLALPVLLRRRRR